MKNLKTLRTNRGLSQQKLAEVLHQTQQSIYKYEHGISEPDIETLIQLSDYFETSIDFLVGNSSIPQKNKIYHPSHLTDSELHHIELYRSLSPQMRLLIDQLLAEYTKK